MRVLLFSPVRGTITDSGDVSYTESLLADPAPGVQYTTYVDAAREGGLTFRGRLSNLHDSPSRQDAVILFARAVEMATRRSRVMFREAYSYVTVDPDRFDLIHQHCFAVKQVGSTLPVVSTAGYPLRDFYRYREGWSPLRCSLAEWLERRYTRAIDGHYPGLQASHGMLTGYTQAFCRWMIERGVDETRVRPLSTGLEKIDVYEADNDKPYIMFAGREFYLKGGDIALDAFRIMRQSIPQLTLKIATVDLPRQYAREPGVLLLQNPNRDETLRAIRNAEVLLHPTRLDGAPYVVLEALQLGVPVVTSRFKWLDDRLLPPAVERVPLSAVEVARAALRVLDDAGRCRQAPSRAAYHLWRDSLSTTSMHDTIRSIYADAIGVSVSPDTGRVAAVPGWHA